MNARSLVFDLFGDYLRYRGGEVRLRDLVMLLGAFDVPEATARVTAARLRKEGWLEARRDGRETVYVLTERAWKLLDEGRGRIFARAPGPWDGRWTMVHVPGAGDRSCGAGATAQAADLARFRCAGTVRLDQPA